MREQKLVRSNECWFQRITPAVAKRFPKYAPFVGMFLVRECTDHLEQNAVGPEGMIFAEQVHRSRQFRREL
jgi:hypothetical protein